MPALSIASSPTTIRLPYRAPFRWDAIAKFLGDRDQLPAIVEPDRRNALRLTVPAGEDDVDDLIARARRTFDLDADPSAIDEHLRRDKLLRPLLAARPGPRVPGAWNPLEVAIRGIVGQQVSVRGATTIMKRCFPTSSWSGMPQARIAAIRGLEQAYADDPSVLTRAASLEESIARLTALRGIGPWTAHYIAMRVLGEPDAFPHSDLGLRKAAAEIGIAPEKLLDHAERWRPWRAYAAVALWESL